MPQSERFTAELVSAFEHARHDDSRVRQYLALAMGRTKNPVFGPVLVEGLNEERPENLPALIYAIGMLEAKEFAPALFKYVEHAEPRVRSIAVVALGNLADPASVSFLKKGLKDSEPNVQWGAAVSLARMGDGSGKEVLIKLLDRQYLSQFAEVDQNEENNLLTAAIEACARLNDQDINDQIKKLSVSDPNMKVRAAALNVVRTNIK
jgi:HEAT repeat protein